MVATNISPPQGGMECTPHHEGSSLNDTIFLCEQTINLQMRAKNYVIPKPSHDAPEETSFSHHGGPLHIEKPYFDTSLFPLKGFLQCNMHNPSTRAACNYSIVEDLAQAPRAMSALKVLQSFPTQQK
jgi:hypothetical protein